uniref:hypothetical protein n=1 Tax=Paenirhodobacter enshiensis TaxID=1105367 RepID=UPI0035B0F292
MTAILKRFRLRRDRACSDASTSGSVPVEGMFGGLMLIIWLLFSFEFYDAFRTRAIVNSSSYVVADLISRQAGGIGPTFVNGVKTIFDQMTKAHSSSATWMRVTIITCSATANTDSCDGTTKLFSLASSYATGTHSPMTQAVLNGHSASIPAMAAGDTAVILETYYDYWSLFNVLSDRPMQAGTLMTFSEFVVTRPRGARTVWNTSL